MRVVKAALLLCSVIMLSAAGFLLYSYPVMAAVACPSCFGLEKTAAGFYTDRDFPDARLGSLASDLDAARDTVSQFYGSIHRQPIVVACSTRECDHRLGGRGARAVTLSTPFFTIVRLAPLGLNKTILAHELSHVEAHQRIGLANQMSGKFPAWFDEGLAVIISQDERYLLPGQLGADGCHEQADLRKELPVSPFDWGRMAGRQQMIYAHAACRVLVWMDAHGGRQGVLDALDGKSAGFAVPAAP